MFGGHSPSKRSRDFEGQASISVVIFVDIFVDREFSGVDTVCNRTHKVHRLYRNNPEISGIGGYSTLLLPRVKLSFVLSIFLDTGENTVCSRIHISRLV